MPREVRRIAAWNLNGLRARFDRLDTWLEHRAPDVIGLQELRCPTTTTAVLARRLGHDAVVGEHAAILAGPGLGPLVDPVDLMEDGRAMAATVGDLRVVSVYAPNGTKAGTASHRAKLEWFEAFTAVLANELAASTQAGDELIVVGDLNVARAEIDIWKPERYRKRNLFTVEERAAVQALLDLGLDDVFRTTHAGAGLYTWWNYAHDSFERQRGWRLDYMLATSALAQRVDHAVVDVQERAETKTSDHAPIWIDVGSATDP